MRRGGLADLAAHYAAVQIRGEVTVLIGPAPDEPADAAALDTELMRALAQASVKDAAAAVAAATGLPKRVVYARALALRAGA